MGARAMQRSVQPPTFDVRRYIHTSDGRQMAERAGVGRINQCTRPEAGANAEGTAGYGGRGDVQR